MVQVQQQTQEKQKSPGFMEQLISGLGLAADLLGKIGLIKAKIWLIPC